MTVRLVRERLLRPLFAGAALLGLAGGPGAAQEAAGSGDRIGVILAAGDIVACNEPGKAYEAVAAVIKAEVDKAGSVPVAILPLGDLAYANRNKGKPVPPSYADCFKEFEKHWGPFYDRIFPVPGNHDFSDDPGKGKVYRTYFAKRLKELGADDKAWFFATVFPATGDGWLLAGINAYRGVDRQREWLPKRLSDAPQRCVLAFAHPFLNSSGHHGRREKTAMTNESMRPFVAALHRAGGSLFLAAHDHDVEQFARQDAEGKAAKDGVRTFVVGTGGARLYAVPDGKRHPLSEAFSNRAHGILKIDLYRDSYAWSFVSASGETAGLPAGKESCNARKPAS